MNKSQAIHQFWSSFGLKAYNQYTVPDDAAIPYITYSVTEDSLDSPVSLTGSLWYRYSWEEIEKKSYEISNALSNGGCVISIDDGRVWICRDTPFAQRMPDVDDTVRRIMINIKVEFLSR